jgi:hypothetical protein
MRRLLADQRGELVLESMGALSFLFLFAFAVAQLADGYAHQLMVRRAASAAVRAAVVVLPDDGRHYGDAQQRTVNQPVEARLRVVEQAMHAVLRGSSSFRARTSQLTLTGGTGPGGQLTATVESEYACLFPLVGLLCGTRQTLKLRASATLPAQYAPYHHQGG